MREKIHMSSNQQSPLRWLLLLWVVLVYVQTLQIALPGQNQNPGKIPPEAVSGPQFNLILFTLLMVLDAGLHWGTFSLRKNRDLLLSFLAQGVLVLLISFLAQAESAVPGLCLALTIEVITLLKQTRLAILVGGGCLLLFGLAQGTQIVSILDYGAMNKLTSIVTGSTTLILFVIACTLLYIQQGRAHQRDQTMLRELESAHAELKTTHDQLETTHKQLEEYAAQVEDLTLIAERQRLARELHDTLAQSLVGLTMQLETIDALLVKQDTQQARAVAQQAMACARTTMTQARAAIEDLRAEALDAQTVVQLVQSEIQRFTSATGIACTCSLPEMFAVPPALHESFLRLVSEGLMNITRHAQAARAWVCGNCEQGTFTFEVGDDGIGFDPLAVAQQAGHYGLLGLRERARLLQGQLDIVSAPGEGTMLRLCLPIGKRGASDER